MLRQLIIIVVGSASPHVATKGLVDLNCVLFLAHGWVGQVTAAELVHPLDPRVARA